MDRCDRCDTPDPAAPTVATVAEGAVRWQQANPGRRRVRIDVRGHVVGVEAEDLGVVAANVQAKFCIPHAAEDVHHLIEAMMRTPHAAVEVGPPLTFREDSGEID